MSSIEQLRKFSTSMIDERIHTYVDTCVSKLNLDIRVKVNNNISALKLNNSSNNHILGSIKLFPTDLESKTLTLEITPIYYAYTDRFAKKLNQVVAHECVHIEQLVSGRLKCDTETFEYGFSHMFWEGKRLFQYSEWKNVTASSLLYPDTYYKLPWEVEANNRMTKILSEYDNDFI